ncbi:MAG: 50S ribosomal protein L3 [Candidatus Levybacteria bacterium]|nr:50S ribosomal protein L3 [Candidatus Levybacteria bacterium]
MIQALIGQKIEQSQMFLENGRRIPVTEVSMDDNIVLQVKTLDKDKYTSVQLGFGGKRKSTKSIIGHIKTAKLSLAPKVIKEVAWDNEGELPNAGDKITVESVFKAGDIIQVTGTSKGKGFAGVMKRHNFRGGPKTHGQSDRQRAPGSIGQTTTPGRVYRGKKMAGRMGSDMVTVRNLSVVNVDAVNKKLYVLGLVPGHKNAMILITRMGEQKDFVPLVNVAMPDAVANENTEANVAVSEEPTTVVEAAAEVAKEQNESAKDTAVKTEMKEEKKSV